MPSLTCLSHLLLHVLRGGLDLDSAVAHPGLVARLGEDGRAVYDLAAAQVEAGLVQGTDYGVTLALTLFERPREVVAGGGDGADLAALRAAQEHAYPFDLDPAHPVRRQIPLIEDGGELVGTALLKDVPVYAQPVVVGELPTDVGGHAADGVSRQKGQAPGVPVAHGPEDERDD